MYGKLNEEMSMAIRTNDHYRPSLNLDSLAEGRPIHAHVGPTVAIC